MEDYKESNIHFDRKMLEDIEDFHEFFMSYKFGEMLQHEDVAIEFRHAIDMLVRSYIHYIRSTLPEWGSGTGTGAREHLDHMLTRKKVLEQTIKYYEEHPE